MRFRFGVRTRIRQETAAVLGRFAHWCFMQGFRAKAVFSRYHNPIPVLRYQGISMNKNQGPAALKKIEHILRTLPTTVKTAVDIGGNCGIFSRALAEQNVFTYYFEPDLDLFSIGFLEACAAPGSMSISRLAVNAETIHLLPAVDATLFLSVMHYWVEKYGWRKSYDLLHVIWSHTAAALYFEMPNPVQNSKMAETLAEMGKTDAECEAFIAGFLGRLPGAEVQLLDYLYTDFRPNERRHLFLARRRNDL